MNSLTIKHRIFVLGLLAVGGIFLAGGLGLFQLSHFNSQLRADIQEIQGGIGNLVEIESAGIDFKTQVQEWKNILIRGNDESELAKYRDAFLQKERTVQERLKKALDSLSKENDPANAEVIKGLQDVLRVHLELGEAYKAALNGFDTHDPESGKKLDAALKGKDRAATEAMNKLVTGVQEGELAHLARQIEESQATYDRARNLQIALMIAGLVLSTMIVWITVRRIARQIAEVQTTTGEIRSSLDLTRRIHMPGHDEMADVAASVNGLLDEFQSVVRRMKEAGSEVSSASDELSHSVTQLASSVEQQNESTSSMAASMEQMAVSLNHVSDSSSTAKDIATQSLGTAEHGSVAIDKTVREMLEMAESAQTTSRTMEALNKRTDEIGGIVGVIKEIADQTNLLALNAAIEAARAGEQGRGFAVVADEVRKLAERTASSTKEIAGLIQSIQTETQNVVEQTHQFVDQVETNAQSARVAGESMVNIHGGSKRVVEVSAEIDTALKEQSTASDLIAKQVEVIATMSDENSSAMEEVNRAAQEMKRLSTGMRELADRFKA